jgi:hypothetical protein
MDANMLQIKNILTIYQLLEINDLTGRLTTDDNSALFDELPAFPQLQYKLRLLIRTMCRAPMADMFMAHNTMMAFSLFCLDKKQQRHILYKQMQLLPSYVTCQCDGITLPQRATFKDAD